jgi:hypothetical protein
MPIYIQANAGGVGNNGNGSMNFNSSQSSSLGHVNLVMVQELSTGSASQADCNSVTDSANNTYTLIQYVAGVPGSGGYSQTSAIWVWACVGIADYSGTNTVSFTGVKAGQGYGDYFDMYIAEYPTASSIRCSNVGSQLGTGSAVVPNVVLTGAVSGDNCICTGSCASFQLSTHGSFGANTGAMVINDGDNGGWEEGHADGSSPMTVTFGTSTSNSWILIALAMTPPGGATVASVKPTNAIFFGIT